MVALQTRLITVQDYHRMIEAGIFGPEERIELIAGQLLPMAAKGAPHRAATTRTRRVLEARLGDRVLVCVQDPVTLDDLSEPEPDVAVVRPDPLDYAEGHPRAEDIFLLVEIADSSLKYDREIKSVAYAKAGVLEYWVLDIQNLRLHVYRSPQLEGYGVEWTLAASEQVAVLSFPDCVVGVAELLGL